MLCQVRSGQLSLGKVSLWLGYGRLTQVSLGQFELGQVGFAKSSLIISLILRYCPQIAFQKLCLANRCQSSRLCMRPLTPSICIYSMLYLQAQKYISLSSFVKRETSNLCSLFLPSYYSHKYRNYQFVKSDVKLISLYYFYLYEL